MLSVCASSQALMDPLYTAESRYEVKTEGDSFTVAFHEADDALKWCSQVQVSLQSLSWPEKLISGG